MNNTTVCGKRQTGRFVQRDKSRCGHPTGTADVTQSTQLNQNEDLTTTWIKVFKGPIQRSLSHKSILLNILSGQICCECVTTFQMFEQMRVNTL